MSQNIATPWLRRQSVGKISCNKVLKRLFTDTKGNDCFTIHLKIPIISTRLFICPKGVFGGLISGKAYFRREVWASKWVGLEDNSLNQLKTANPNSPWVYIARGGGEGNGN